MEKTILLILNKGELPFYLEDLCRAIMSLKEYRLYRYHIATERKFAPSFSTALQPAIYPQSKLNTENFLPELPDSALHTAPDLLINLTDLPFPTLPWVESKCITPDFLSGLSGTFSTAIAKALLEQKKALTCGIFLSTPSGSHHLLAEGTFIVLPYNYKTTLELAVNGVIQLLLTAISGSTHHPTGFSIHVLEDKEPITAHEIVAAERTLKKAKRRHRMQQVLFNNTWNIGIIAAPIEQVALQPGKKWEVQWLPEVAGESFRADPFGIIEDGKPVLFYENYNGFKGELFIQPLNGEPRKLLDSPYHFSYPYLLEDNGIIYCLPEQQASGKLKLYNYHPKEKSLEEICSLLEGFQAVDPSLVFYQEKWWLFCTNAAQKGADIRLYIFHADNLKGPWSPHDLNPVKTDIRSARPGGHFFTHEGHLYRPSQDSSSGYGAALVINRIDKLSTSHFSETIVNRLLPEQLTGIYQEGWHTISSCGNFTLVDGKRKKFNLRNLLKIFRKK